MNPGDMVSEKQALKARMRREVAARIACLSKPCREQASALACARLQEKDAWQRAGFVLGYSPLDGELDVWPLLQEALKRGKTAALPRFDPKSGMYLACQVTDLGRDLAPGRYGIREPVRSCAAALPLNRLDFVLVPGVAFDLHGRRLGRGKGYYDRLLAAVRGKVCGVAFDEQIVREVPAEPHDSDVNCILTPTRWIEL